MIGPTAERWHRDALPKGTQLHGYTIEAILGRGGFGITYRARDRLDQIFAVKECFPWQFAVRQGLEVLPKDVGDDAIFADCLGRFLREAKALVLLSQIGQAGDTVVKVMTLFEVNGTAYIVMEYLPGEGLEALIRANPAGLDSQVLTDLLLRLLQGLGFVHNAGLLHRDIKPANILLREDGRPVLIDFGATRMVAGANQHTVFTQIYSERYAPIEQQLEGGQQGRYSDLYALGMTCYQAIGGTVIGAVARERALHRGDPDPLPRAAQIGAGRYPQTVLAAIDAVLTVAPEGRPQDIAEMRALLGNDQPTKLVQPPLATRPTPLHELPDGQERASSKSTALPPLPPDQRRSPYGHMPRAQTSRLELKKSPGVEIFELTLSALAVIILVGAVLGVVYFALQR